jgi:hypothetical protein
VSLIFLSFGVTLLFFYNLGVLLYNPCMLELYLSTLLINIDYFKKKKKKVSSCSSNYDLKGAYLS